MSQYPALPLMSIRQILPIEHATLRRVCSRVRGVGSSVRDLMTDLEETMLNADGIGLAAPQIGKPWRVIAVRDNVGVFTIANPEIIRGVGNLVAEEGCLSLPLFYGPVRRHTEITVRGLDVRGKNIRRKAVGLMARALQHEIDHLNGVIFRDKLVGGGQPRFAGVQREDLERRVTD